MRTRKTFSPVGSSVHLDTPFCEPCEASHHDGEEDQDSGGEDGREQGVGTVPVEAHSLAAETAEPSVAAATEQGDVQDVDRNCSRDDAEEHRGGEPESAGWDGAGRESVRGLQGEALRHPLQGEYSRVAEKRDEEKNGQYSPRVPSVDRFAVKGRKACSFINKKGIGCFKELVYR